MSGGLRLCVAFAVSIWCGHAEAASYRLISLEKDHSSFINLETVRGTVSAKRVWVTTIFSSEKQLEDYTYDYVVTRSEVNCAKEVSRPVGSALYKIDGTFVKLIVLHAAWEPIVPETAGATIEMIACHPGDDHAPHIALPIIEIARGDRKARASGAIDP